MVKRTTTEQAGSRLTVGISSRSAKLDVKLSDEVGKWGGDIGKAKLPDRFVVDYVRVYDLADRE